jgi:hypothetical protein
MIIIPGENTRELYSIHINEDGKYMAIRTEEPLFCFESDTVIGVVTRAERAFEFYKERVAK